MLFSQIAAEEPVGKGPISADGITVLPLIPAVYTSSFSSQFNLADDVGADYHMFSFS